MITNTKKSSAASNSASGARGVATKKLLTKKPQNVQPTNKVPKGIQSDGHEEVVVGSPGMDASADVASMPREIVADTTFANLLKPKLKSSGGPVNGMNKHSKYEK